jgi:hypothetical protein
MSGSDWVVQKLTFAGSSPAARPVAAFLAKSPKKWQLE